jgi:lipopolysaccharide export system protein LptC
VIDRRLVLIIAMLAVFALATQAVVWFLAPREEESAFVGPPRSDYTLTDFTLDSLDEQGQHAFSMVAPRMARRQDDGSIYITTPDYDIVDNSGNVWKGTSESAWVNKDGTIMKLLGAVDMHRLPTEKVTPVQILTRDLTVLSDPKVKNSQQPRERRMETTELTTVIDPTTVAHGVGMKANMTLKIVEFLSEFHSTTQPSKIR